MVIDQGVGGWQGRFEARERKYQRRRRHEQDAKPGQEQSIPHQPRHPHLTCARLPLAREFGMMAHLCSPSLPGRARLLLPCRAWNS